MSDEKKECFHCSLPVPINSSFQVEIDGLMRDMCCPGCKAVAQAIVDGGLSHFYHHRTVSSPTAQNLIPEALDNFSIYDQKQIQRSFISTEGNTNTELRQASLILEGIVCAACVWLNERHVNQLAGVLEFRVNYSTHRANVKWDDSRIHLSEILKAIASIGYVAHPFDPGRQEKIYKNERRQALKRLAVAGLGAMQVMMLAVALYAGAAQGMESKLHDFLRWVSLIIATPVVFYSARLFFIGAWRDVRHFQLGMDVPVAVAIGSAYAASLWATMTNSGEIYFDSVTMFTFFLLTGRFLEMAARHRAGQAAEELVKLIPAMATRIRDTGEEVVAVADLVPGDYVQVKPGESIPADGIVTEGISSVDESLLTGESLPLNRIQGDHVIGGTVNIESPMKVKIEKVGEETVLASIQRLLNRAQSEKPHLATLADRVAGVFVAVILLLALVVGYWWMQYQPDRAFWVVLSMLVVTCPCALSLATPAALTAATGTLTKLGVLTTRGHALETLSKVSHVVFDKTGTLTTGRLSIDRIQVLGELAQDKCNDIVARLESVSEHPIAKVLCTLSSETPEMQNITALPGQGIEAVIAGEVYRVGQKNYVAELCQGETQNFDEASGQSQVFLANRKEFLAVYELSDTLREGAEKTIEYLKKQGLIPLLFSGDSEAAVKQIASTLGIENYSARMKPEDKLSAIKTLQESGAIVAMIGDGVNDAPVLAAAQVSIAMGSGTQLAQASADMVLLSEQLLHLPRAFEMAEATLRIIRQNLGWAILYNIIALPLAASGMIAPWMAAIGMSASSLIVVLNALRLKKHYNDHSRTGMLR